MKAPSFRLRVLSCHFAVWLAVPGPVWAQLTVTGPSFPDAGTVRVGLAGAAATNAHIIFWSPTLGPDLNSWFRLTTGSVGQTSFDFSRPTNRESYFRAAVAPVAVPTVATPQFSPGGGSYGGPTNVTITCATAGAALYYTTNGST
ncbi:MAG: chitobiase/beta-hexosaminidase C-terminal domain-containing protein, partial [Limisphaerales bacterium]